MTTVEPRSCFSVDQRPCSDPISYMQNLHVSKIMNQAETEQVFFDYNAQTAEKSQEQRQDMGAKRVVYSVAARCSPLRRLLRYKIDKRQNHAAGRSRQRESGMKSTHEKVTLWTHLHMCVVLHLLGSACLLGIHVHNTACTRKDKNSIRKCFSAPIHI